MTRRQKLIEKAMNNPAGIRFKERCLLAEPYQVKQMLVVIEKYRMGERE
jgi:hypothetical protein